MLLFWLLLRWFSQQQSHFHLCTNVACILTFDPDFIRIWRTDARSYMQLDGKYVGDKRKKKYLLECWNYERKKWKDNANKKKKKRRGNILISRPTVCACVILTLFMHLKHESGMKMSIIYSTSTSISSNKNISTHS